MLIELRGRKKFVDCQKVIYQGHRGHRKVGRTDVPGDNNRYPPKFRQRPKNPLVSMIYIELIQRFKG